MLISCLGREEAFELVSDVTLFVRIVKKGEEEKARKSSARRPSARIGRIISPSLSLFPPTRRSGDPGWVTYGVLARLQLFGPRRPVSRVLHDSERLLVRGEGAIAQVLGKGRGGEG